MKILAHIHKYPPVHNAGAEWMMHSVLTWMAARAHEVRVIAAHAESSYEFEGVPVTAGRVDRDLYDWADVVLTHLDLTRVAVRESRAAGRPLVHFVHNGAQLRFHSVRRDSAALVVFNSDWLLQSVPWRGPKIVCRPPVFLSDYEVIPDREWECVTLINLAEAKGAPIFYELAQRFPNVEFLGIRGAYGEQIVPEPLPPNVRVLPNQPNMREVYAQTKLLLMPSSYESWGRVAIEAAASGIPTIGAPTPGLAESLGPALTPVALGRIDDWAWALSLLLENPDAYRIASDRARTRALQLSETNDLERLEGALEEAVRTTPRVARRSRTAPHYLPR